MPANVGVAANRSASLGIIAKSAAAPMNSGPEASERRLMRWALHSHAGELLPRERVHSCLRRRIPGVSNVDVLYSPARGRSSYGGLMQCGSVWQDPICAAKITERRKHELEAAIVAARQWGLAVYLQTTTVRHSQRDRLGELVAAFMTAQRAAKSNRLYAKLKADCGYMGAVRALEVTHGGSGWHPHCHELVFLSPDTDPDRWREGMARSWSAAADRAGLSMNEHGYDLRPTFGAVEEYLSKYGHEPQSELPWGTSSELTKLHVKQGRGGSETPFGLLRLSFYGIEQAGALFREFAGVFKGRRQLVWTPNLRAVLLGEETPELTDEELVTMAEEGLQLLGQLSPAQWRVVLANDCRGELLEVASGGDWSAVLSWLSMIGAAAA